MLPPAVKRLRYTGDAALVSSLMNLHRMHINKYIWIFSSALIGILLLFQTRLTSLNNKFSQYSEVSINELPQ